MAIVRAIPRSSFAIVLAALILASAILVNTFYTARGDQHDTTFYACLYAGSLSQVGTIPPLNCGRGTLVQWNAEGQVGPVGETGSDGIHCWDLNGNRMNDPDEDVNGDQDFNALDCLGPEGPQGPPGTVLPSMFTIRSSEATEILGFQEGYALAACELDEIATGGGYFYSGALEIQSSRPIGREAVDGEPPAQWLVQASNTEDFDAELTAYAVCIASTQPG